jgi:hypothetical protein
VDGHMDKIFLPELAFHPMHKYQHQKTVLGVNSQETKYGKEKKICLQKKKKKE